MTGVQTCALPISALIPKDLELAVNLYVSLLRRVAQFGGGQPQSENLGNYGYSLLGPPPPEAALHWGTIQKIASRYREVAI